MKSKEDSKNMQKNNNISLSMKKVINNKERSQNSKSNNPNSIIINKELE